MKRYATDHIRNLVLIGHGGSGKTSLAEALLHAAGVVDRLGAVAAGTTVGDSDPDEIERGISISAALLPCAWREHKLNLLDTPGYADFVGEVIACLRVADGAIVTLDAVAGVEVQTERYWQMARQRGIVPLIVVTKLDKEGADFAGAMQSARDRLGCNVVATHLPIGAAQGLRGVVDLLAEQALIWRGDKVSQEAPPAAMADDIAVAREVLMEAAAEADDELTEKYLEQGALTNEDMSRGLRAAVLAGRTVAAVPVAAVSGIGVQAAAEAVVSYLPGPAQAPAQCAVAVEGEQQLELRADPEQPLAALVFKTMADPFAGRLTVFRVYQGVLHSDGNVYNANRRRRERVGQISVPRGKQQEAVAAVGAGDMGVVAKLHETVTGDVLCDEQHQVTMPALDFPEPVLAVAVQPKSKGDEDKVNSGLDRLREEDPTIGVSTDPDTRQTLLSGMGDLHLEVIVGRLKRKFGVEVEIGTPRVAYRETITKTVQVQGKYKRQTGGRGQYGDVWVRVEPQPRGAGFEFADEIAGGVVPRNYIPAVGKGIAEAMQRGVVAGYPLVDLRAALYDGSYHSVDSSEMAFKIAGSMALQKAVAEAEPRLLEPIMNVEVTVPDQHMGDIIGHLNGKRGRIQGMEPGAPGSQVVLAQVPLAEMFAYATELRSMTQGRASYRMKFSHYEEVPGHIAQRIIDEAQQRKQEQPQR
ncbi:MAG TPA: elongation factor G [Armatimonadota bacterium]|nr:elongation factor G [Armatimonadota bacterium]